MIRALTTLVGLVCAAALLLLVTDTGSAEGGGLWQRAALLAGAGPGRRRLLPTRRHPPAGRASQHAAADRRLRAVDAARGCDLRASRGHARLAQRPRHRHPPGQRAERWSASFPILAFTDGLLLAFALVEPLVQDHVRRADVVEEAPPLGPSRSQIRPRPSSCGRTPSARRTPRDARRGAPRRRRSRAGVSCAHPAAAR